MRIRTILAAAAAPAAIAAALLGSTGAHASTLTAGSGNPNGVIAKMTGQTGIGYNDPVFGAVKVNETSHAANGGHAAFDTIGATFTGGQVMTPGSTGDIQWFSDFTPGSGSPEAGQYGTLHYTINAAGDGYSGTATYPNG